MKAGESISIPCLYDSQYENYLKYLCKGYYYRECTYAVDTNQPGESGKYSISDDKKQRIFTVTIKKLNTDQDSYYWCAVEIPGIWGDVRVYFHLSVIKGKNPKVHSSTFQISQNIRKDLVVIQELLCQSRSKQNKHVF